MKTTKMLFYCTMGKPYLYKDVDNKFKLSNKPVLNSLNGKIVAECEVETEEISGHPYLLIDDEDGIGVAYDHEEKLIRKSCLSYSELCDYIGVEGYALHIKNLKIFDNPKHLFDYYVYKKGGYGNYPPVQKAPQNMMKVYDYEGNSYIAISIHPEWLCKIFNGEKEIEVRKKVMKEMLSNGN